MEIRKVFVAVVIVAAVLNGCAKKDNAVTCSYDPCALQASANEITQVESYLAGANITTATKHCSGMYYLVTNAGAGATPNACSYVSVTYKGMLTNGNVFDSTATPVVFPLATLIESWKKGIPLVKPGGSITLYVPPSLGYGASDQKDRNGVVIIPGGSILIFTIQLLDVQ